MSKNTKRRKRIVDNMIIAVIIMIISIFVIYYAIRYFSPEEIIPYGGYAISGKQLTENLLSGNSEEEIKPKIVQIDEQEMIFKRWNNYYIGSKENIEININYPIYINNKVALYNLSSNNILITNDFEQIDSYPRYTLVDGILYNEGDLERADQNVYLFIKNKDNIFINQNQIDIKTQYNNYQIPKNSMIYFTDKSITYYSMEKYGVVYNKIEDIDANSSIEIQNNKDYTYLELLVNLKLKETKKKQEPKEEPKQQEPEEKQEKFVEEIQENEVKEEPEQQEPEENEEKVETKEIQQEEKKEETQKNEQTGEQTHIYIKPEVNCTNFEANVYSAKATITIQDPSGEITSPIQFEFRKKGKIYLRKSVISSGILEITGLEPNEKYNITASYIFLNGEGQKVQKEILSQEIQTKGVDILEPIKLDYQNGELFSTKIQVKDIKIVSNLSSEALKGIKRLELLVNNVSYKIPTSKINQMLRGEAILQETQETIESNSNVNYEFKAYDIIGNELKIENKSGQTKTAKLKPVANIKVSKQDISEVQLSLALKNKDNVNIQNYCYKLFDIKGTLIKEGVLNKSQNELKLYDLDPNKYYSLFIYCDYDIEDGKGIIKDEKIGTCNFTSVPLSTLGYLHMDVTLKETTKESATIDMAINSQKTDARLIYILQKIEISIYEEKDGEEILTDTKIISAEELENLKSNENMQIMFEDLKSKTNYKIEAKSIVQQGNTVEDIKVIKSLERFTTKKKPAEILIKNQFVTGSIIDFEVKANDIDEAILTNKVRMELRDEKDKLLKMESIDTNEDYTRLTYDKLDEKSNYTIKFYADEYNEGNDYSTYKNNYLLKTLEIFTEVGISGDVSLINLEREGTGKNLIDVKSDVKWYSAVFNTWGYYDKTYNEKTGELNLYAGKSGYAQYYVYNLKQYAGQTITISFLAKLDKHSDRMAIYLQNSKTGANRTRITGITEDEWQRYTYTVTLDNSGYIGFYLLSANDTDEQRLILKELQVELGNRRTTYEPYKYNVEGQLKVNLIDKRDEIQGKDYYIKIEEDGAEKSFERYIEIDENGTVQDAIKQYRFEENKKYKISLLVQRTEEENFYEISSTEFTTDGEILGISNNEEFLQIQPNGNYIILNDIDLLGVSREACRFGCGNFGIRGKIDFQGHKLIRTSAQTQYGIFYFIERTGSIENLVLDLHLNNDIEYGWFRGLFTTNSGTVKNLMVNLKECNEFPNTNFGLIGYQVASGGKLENFVINMEVPLYGARVLSGGVLYNYGDIKNGYIYGQNIEAKFSIAEGQWRDSAGLVYYNDRGIVENVYSLVHVNSAEQTGRIERSASIMEVNNRGIVKNVYSVGRGSSKDLNYGPTIGVNQSGKVYNSYYFCDDIFTNTYNLKTTKLALYDQKFQTLMLNSNGQFLVEDLISQNYYPQVKMSDKMPNQEYLSLPQVEDRDLVDILSYEVVEDNTDKIKMELSINNPSGEQIRSIQVKDISARIISQEYKDGKTTLIMELSNPKRYISKYSIMSITSQGALNLPYTRNYQEDERNIYVDFYKKVNSIEDWKEINKSPTENYRLMTDLDFLNCEKEIIITNQYTGKIDGNNHTIKNIKIPKDANNYGLIYNLNGEIKNLYVENFSKENPTNSAYNGFISLAYSNTVIDNVHIKNERLSCSIVDGTNYSGGLISSASDLIIRNSSVTGLSINLSGELNNARAGGLVGNGSNVRIENCFVQDLDITTKGILIYYGIGGIIGRDAGGIIDYCYTTGNITTDAENTGGIYGYTTGTVKHSYSIMNIKSETDYVGGIGGYDNNTSTVSTLQNLYLGNIYSSKQSTYINRIQGNTVTEEENYAYAGQKINGFINTEDLGAEKLLTYNEIFDKGTYENLLEFGEDYNYDELSRGILPKLYNTAGESILPNQKDNKLEAPEIYIEEVEAEKADVTTARVRIVVNNPAGVDITGAEIEYANVEVIRSVYESGKTYIDLTVKPERAYDSYTINKITYEENGEQKTLDTQAKLDIQFYNEINNFEDWQKIDSESAQNYRLNADIDFTGKINPKINVSIGRLEAEGDGHTLKNLEVNVSGTSKGFIKEVKSTIRNITFENITVNNTANSGNYTGLIVRNIANIEKTNFKNITINSPRIGYVGIIANNSALEIKNIKLENITVSGTQHVGGFMGITDSGDFQYIELEKANITATSSYSGSVIGRIVAREPYRVRDITVNDATVKGASYTGGIIGQGRTQYLEITNSNISGVSYVGGIVGYMDYNVYNTDITSRNCTITGTGSYIGGVGGYIYYINAAFSIDNTVTATSTSSNGIGGIAGLSYQDLRQSGAINTTIKTNGTNAGGLIGVVSGDEIYFSYAYNCTVEANQNAGGLVGSYRQGILAFCYSNSTVTAYTNSAGGMVGFLNNADMTGANYTSRIYQCYVAGTKVTAPTQVGGIIGSTVEPLYDSRFYYSNYVEAYLNSNTTLVSMGIGSDKNQNSTINRFYVYEKSTINGQVVTTNSDNIPSGNFVKRDDLYKRQTYTTIGINSYYDFSKITQGKYPLAQVSNVLVKYQEGIDFPSVNATNNALGKALTLSAIKMNISLPEINLYCTGANKINLELESIEDNLELYYTPEGEETKQLQIGKKVYTFQYDYKTKVELEITNGVLNKKITIDPEEISNKISLIDDKTYYLKENKLYNQTEEIEGKFVNLYQNEALSEVGKIYDIKEQKWGEEITEGFKLLEETTPLETTTYNELEIETYAGFTLLKSSNNEMLREGKILVKNNELSFIDSTLEEKSASSEIINNYNNKEYQTILGEDNKLYDLKTPLTYPENFVNKNIESITTSDSDKTYVTVQYESGKVITFDYTTGEIIFDNQVKEDISLVDYIKQALSIENIKSNVVEDAEEKYQESETLKQKLEKDSIEKVLNQEQNEQANEKYITAYDNAEKEYVVYKESELLDLNTEDYQSESSKISQSAELTRYYGAKKEKSKQTNGLVWIIPTISAVIASLAILIIRNRRKKEQ